MAYQNLREFVARLEREQQLKRIRVPIDVDLEITEITDRVSKAGGPALLFEKPCSAQNNTEYRLPLLIILSEPGSGLRWLWRSIPSRISPGESRTSWRCGLPKVSWIRCVCCPGSQISGRFSPNGSRTGR